MSTYDDILLDEDLNSLINDPSTSDLKRGLEELAASRPDYEAARKYADNTIAESWFSPRLRRMLATKGLYRLNFASVPIEVLASKLEIRSFSVVSDDDTAQEVMQNIWDDNELDLQAPFINRATMEYGDYYAIVDITTDIDGENPQIQIDVNDPIQVRICYSIESPLLKEFAIKLWEAEDGYLRANLYYCDRVEKFRSNAPASDLASRRRDRFTGGANSGDVSIRSTAYHIEDFVPFLDTVIEGPGDAGPLDVWPVYFPTPYSELPVFHFRVGSRPYGKPEHINAYGPQEAINKLIDAQMSNIEFAIAPQKYALSDGTEPTPGTEGGDSDFEDVNLNQQVIDTEARRRQTASLESGPNVIQWLPGVKAVGEFAPADPKALLDPLDFHIRSMALLTQTSAHYFSPTGDAPSGESLRAADAPTTKKAKDRSQQLGSTWDKMLAFCMESIGFLGVKVHVKWAGFANTDDAEFLNALVIKRALGVPDRVILAEAGYDDDEMDDWGVPQTEGSYTAPAAVAIEAPGAIKE